MNIYKVSFDGKRTLVKVDNAPTETMQETFARVAGKRKLMAKGAFPLTFLDVEVERIV